MLDFTTRLSSYLPSVHTAVPHHCVYRYHVSISLPLLTHSRLCLDTLNKHASLHDTFVLFDWRLHFPQNDKALKKDIAGLICKHQIKQIDLTIILENGFSQTSITTEFKRYGVDPFLFAIHCSHSLRLLDN